MNETSLLIGSNWKHPGPRPDFSLWQESIRRGTHASPGTLNSLRAIVIETVLMRRNRCAPDGHSDEKARVKIK